MSGVGGSTRLTSIAIVTGSTLAAAGAYHLFFRDYVTRPHDDARRAVGVSAAQIGFSPVFVDLGEQIWGQEVPFELKFVNNSEAPLTVGTLSSSCGCILFDAEALAGARVSPGESLPVSGVLHAGRKPGKLTRQVFIEDDDGIRFEAKVALDVVPTYTVSTSLVDFGPVSLQLATGPTETVLFSGDDLDFVDGPQVSCDWLSAEYETQSPGDTLMRVDLLPERLAAGVNTATIRVQTSDKAMPVQIIAVRAVGTQPLRAIPSVVALKTGERKEVAFVDINGEAAPILSAECDDACISLSLDDGVLTIANEGGSPGSARVRAAGGNGLWGTVLVHLF